MKYLFQDIGECQFTGYFSPLLWAFLYFPVLYVYCTFMGVNISMHFYW